MSNFFSMRNIMNVRSGLLGMRLLSERKLRTN